VNLSVEALSYYVDHPVEFLQDLVDGVDFDQWQIDAFEALQKDHFVAIRSGSGVGKTVFLALALLWFLATRPNSRVPCTAPSQHQLFDLLWAECYKWISNSEYLGHILRWKQTKIGVVGHEPNWYAVARTARVSPDGTVAEGLQGFHAEDNLLFIVDEASGVPDAIYPAIEGAFTGPNAYCILASNPTRDAGYFHSVFNDINMHGLYHLIHVSGLDSKFVSERWIKMMKARYGEDHPIYKIKVLGEFPGSIGDLLIPPDYLEKMVNNDRSVVSYDGAGHEFGVDIGRTSNRTVLTVRRGNQVLKIDVHAYVGKVDDAIDIGNWIVEHAQAYRPTAIKIDATGLGAPIYDYVKRLYPAITYAVYGSASPEGEFARNYLNLRAQGYWELRNIIPHLYCNSWPDQLLVELGTLKFQMANGKIKMPPKESMSTSPDHADSLMYAFLRAELCAKQEDAPNFVGTLTKVNEEFRKTSRWDLNIPSSGLRRFQMLH